jgi:hypothetical protein
VNLGKREAGAAAWGELPLLERFESASAGIGQWIGIIANSVPRPVWLNGWETVR